MGSPTREMALKKLAEEKEMDKPKVSSSVERKATPVVTGVLDYFPLAIKAIARLSKKANDKHNPGEPMHWARGKSNDHADCIGRHLIERGVIDPEFGELHDVALAWRALANLELAEEKRLGLVHWATNGDRINDGDMPIEHGATFAAEYDSMLGGGLGGLGGMPRPEKPKPGRIDVV